MGALRQVLVQTFSAPVRGHHPPIELRSGELISVDIVVTNRISTVSGQLSDEGGRLPVVDATVVVFAQDPAQWGEDSSKVRAVRPDRRGRYQVKGLPAGEYLAIALEYVENGLWYDPEFLESVRSYAQRLTVIDADAHELALKLVRPETLK